MRLGRTNGSGFPLGGRKHGNGYWRSLQKSGQGLLFRPQRDLAEAGRQCRSSRRRAAWNSARSSPAPRTVSDEQIVTPLKKVAAHRNGGGRFAARPTTPSREEEAFRICQEKIAKHKLEMKLVSVEYTFDNSKIIFYFTANGRVDFRELVKDLASRVQNAHRAAPDRRARRGEDAGRTGLLRAAHLLRRVPGRFPARVHQDGQGAEPLAEPYQDFRPVRPADVLPEVRAGHL